MKNHILMISGQQGSGKTTLTEMIIGKYRHKGWDAHELRFARPLYDMHAAVLRIMQMYGFKVPAKDGRLLQLLGTEWGREVYGENVWVDAVKNVVRDIITKRDEYITHNGVDSKLLLVISDCRFRNEFDAFPEALRVRLKAPADIRKKRADGWRDNENHPSEVDLDQYDADGRFDLYVNTDGSIPLVGCTELIMAKIDKGGWVERRKS